MATKPSTTWLITGASGGLGLALAMAALRRGKKVLAATRNPAKAAAEHPELESQGGIWLDLDINQPAAHDIVSTAVQHHAVDVLVNNAATAFLGAAEDMTTAEFASSFTPNVFAPHRTARAALPHFRAARTGTIVNIGSGAGLWGVPSRTAYCATKFALAGFSEALHREVSAYGVRVLLVEPGAFRTPFAASVRVPAAAGVDAGGNGNVSAPYVGGVADQVVDATRPLAETAKGDPVRAAGVVLDAVDRVGFAEGKEFIRLPVGPDAVAVLKRKIALLTEELALTEEAACSTDFVE